MYLSNLYCITNSGIYSEFVQNMFIILSTVFKLKKKKNFNPFQGDHLRNVLRFKCGHT